MRRRISRCLESIATVACADCHTHGDFKTPVAHALCADCHKDAHHGQFAARADKGECGACHTVEGFKPSTFTVAAHAATMYPLDGRARHGCLRPVPHPQGPGHGLQDHPNSVPELP